MIVANALLSDDEVRELASIVLSELLETGGVDSLDVSSGLDEDGELSLFVTARMRPVSEAMIGLALGDATTALRHALEARGDGRFPYIRFEYVGEEEAPFDEDEAYPSAARRP